jgi:glycerol transport system ATP-binding protein
VGSPTDLFERPAHTFVGHFIGSPGMNLLPCELGEGGVRVDGHTVPVAPERLQRARQAKSELVLGIRPEFVRCQARESSGGLAAEVTGVEDLGAYKIATARLGRHLVKAKLKETAEITTGPGFLVFPPEWTLLYSGGSALD